MKHVRWFLVVTITAWVLVGCGDKKNSVTDKTPPPAVEVAPLATTAAILPEVQTGGTTNQQTSPLATPTPISAAVTSTYAYSIASLRPAASPRPLAEQIPGGQTQSKMPLELPIAAQWHLRQSQTAELVQGPASLDCLDKSRSRAHTANSRTCSGIPRQAPRRPAGTPRDENSRARSETARAVMAAISKQAPRRPAGTTLG